MMLTITNHDFPADARPACVGQSELFDATDAESHEKAKAICRTCPVMTKCAILATTVETPTGTWAARLHSGTGRSSVDIEAEEAMFTDDEARKAYNAWQRGERTELNKIGRRVYKRRTDAMREGRRADDGTLLTITEKRFADEDAMFTEDEARRGATAYRMGDKSERNALAQRVHKRRQRQARLEAAQSEGAA